MAAALSALLSIETWASRSPVIGTCLFAVAPESRLTHSSQGQLSARIGLFPMQKAPEVTIRLADMEIMNKYKRMQRLDL